MMRARESQQAGFRLMGNQQQQATAGAEAQAAPHPFQTGDYNFDEVDPDRGCMLRLTPFLLFEGNCAEAMEFYHSCFGGELTLTKLGDTPMRTQFPREQHGKITHAILSSGAIALTATDWLHPTRRPMQGNTTALSVTGNGYDELSPIFEKLRVEGDAALLVTLREMPFGIYGRLTDRFGVEWFFRGRSTGSVPAES